MTPYEQALCQEWRMSSVVLLVSLLLLHKMEECLKSAVVKSRKVDLSSNSIPVSVTALRCVRDQSAVRSNGFLQSGADIEKFSQDTKWGGKINFNFTHMQVIALCNMHYVWLKYIKYSEYTQYKQISYKYSLQHYLLQTR